MRLRNILSLETAAVPNEMVVANEDDEVRLRLQLGEGLVCEHTSSGVDFGIVGGENGGSGSE